MKFDKNILFFILIVMIASHCAFAMHDDYNKGLSGGAYAYRGCIYIAYGCKYAVGYVGGFFSGFYNAARYGLQVKTVLPPSFTTRMLQTVQNYRGTIGVVATGAIIGGVWYYRAHHQLDVPKTPANNILIVPGAETRNQNSLTNEDFLPHEESEQNHDN